MVSYHCSLHRCLLSHLPCTWFFLGLFILVYCHTRCCLPAAHRAFLRYTRTLRTFYTPANYVVGFYLHWFTWFLPPVLPAVSTTLATGHSLRSCAVLPAPHTAATMPAAFLFYRYHAVLHHYHTDFPLRPVSLDGFLLGSYCLHFYLHLCTAFLHLWIFFGWFLLPLPFPVRTFAGSHCTCRYHTGSTCRSTFGLGLPALPVPATTVTLTIPFL